VVVVEAAGQRLDQCVAFQPQLLFGQTGKVSGSCSPSMRACIMARPDTPRMSVATTDSFTQASCGVFSSSVKGWVLTRSRAIPYGTAVLRLVWRKRRWRCTEVVCARGSFIEAIPAVPTRARLTVRLRAELAHAVAEQHRCVAETAAHYQVGWATVHDAFIAHVAEPLAAPAPPVRVLGIDETRRGKPIWARRTRTHSGGCWRATAGTPGSSTPQAPVACWPRSRAAPRRP